MRVAIVHDRIPENANQDELDTLVQAEAIAAALEGLGYETVRIPFSLDLEASAATIERAEANLLFNLVESVAGRGHFIHLAPALFDGLKIPYTGCPTEAIFTTGNKVMTKRRLELAGIPTADCFTAKESPRGGASPGRFKPGATYIVKAIWEEASIGLDPASVRVYGSPEELRHAIAAKARELGTGFFAEEYIDGREFNVGLLAGADGPVALPIAEMRFDGFPAGRPRILDYKAKWHEETEEYRHSVRGFDFPPADRPLLARLAEISLRCWKLFDLNGYARVDFRVAADGTPYVLELNANPCISPDSGFIAMARRAGLDYAAVIDRIVNHGTVEKY